MKKVFVVLLSTFLCAFAHDLLIGHADPDETSGVEENIAGDPYYDTVDLEDWRSQTPTVDHLLEYDCVFTWSSMGYADPTALGNNLADYVDLGGAVAILNFCWDPSSGLGGRIMNDTDYCPLAPVYDVRDGDRRGDPDMGDYDDLHPIMDGVASITGIYYWSYLSVLPGATWLAELTNGYDLAGINADESVVGINMYPGDTHQWQGDGWLLFNNAIKYLLGDWPGVSEVTWGALKAAFE
jgi:hypothetical protein